MGHAADLRACDVAASLASERFWASREPCLFQLQAPQLRQTSWSCHLLNHSEEEGGVESELCWSSFQGLSRLQEVLILYLLLPLSMC